MAATLLSLSQQQYKLVDKLSNIVIEDHEGREISNSSSDGEAYSSDEDKLMRSAQQMARSKTISDKRLVQLIWSKSKVMVSNERKTAFNGNEDPLRRQKNPSDLDNARSDRYKIIEETKEPQIVPIEDEPPLIPIRHELESKSQLNQNDQKINLSELSILAELKSIPYESNTQRDEQ